MVGCLVIHGYTGSPYEVKPLVEYLRKKTDWEIVAPTLPGHGPELDLADASHEAWLGKAEEVMIALQAKYDTIYVIGFSMGGMIAAHLVSKYDVDKLVLLAPAGRFLSVKQMALDLGDLVTDGVRGKLEENDNYLHYKHKGSQIPMKAHLEFVKLIRHTRPALKEIDIPVFIAQGQQDTIVPPRTVYYLDKEIPSLDKEVVLLNDSEHIICHGNDKDLLNRLVGEFLNIEENKK